MWNGNTLVRLAVLLGLVGIGLIAMLHESLDDEQLESAVTEQVQTLTHDTGPAHAIF